MVLYMYIALRQGQITPWGQIVFIISIFQSIKSFAASFPTLNDFVTKFQDHRTSGSGEEFFKMFSPYMDMAAILVM